MKNNSTNRDGFSLIELIAVMAIIGIVYLIAAPMYSGFQGNILLKSTAKTVASYIDRARSLASTFNRDFEVAFDTANGKISLNDSLTADSGDDTVQKVKDFFIPRQITLTTNAPGEKLTFSSSGSTSACSIWLQKKNTTKYYTLTTESSTGAVRIYNYKP